MEYIQTALLELLEEKRLDRITVKDVCANAHVSRQTIYYHYDSLVDVFISWFRSGIAEKLKTKNTVHNWGEGYREILAFCKNHRKPIINVYKSSYRDDFLASIDALGRRLIERAVDDVSNEIGIPMLQQDRAFMVDFYMFVFMGFLKEYIENGMEQDYEFIASRCELMMGSSIRNREKIIFDSYR